MIARVRALDARVVRREDLGQREHMWVQVVLAARDERAVPFHLDRLGGNLVRLVVVAERVGRDAAVEAGEIDVIDDLPLLVRPQLSWMSHSLARWSGFGSGSMT